HSNLGARGVSGDDGDEGGAAAVGGSSLTGGAGQRIAITRLEDAASETMYEARNEVVGPDTRREIARLAGCVRVLVEQGVRVDEEMVMRAYEASLELEDDIGEGDEGPEYLGGDRGNRVVAEVLHAAGVER
ncbi:MAG: hypothetical protein Q9163_003894, partial [Psora crenata]